MRVILTTTVHLNWKVRHLHINNPFLNGHLMEIVFMNQLEGYIDYAKPNHICRLSKTIYGLKQVHMTWYDNLKGTLLSRGFINTKNDTSLFVQRGKEHMKLLLIYVNDIIVIVSNNNFLKKFIIQLNRNSGSQRY